MCAHVTPLGLRLSPRASVTFWAAAGGRPRLTAPFSPELAGVLGYGDISNRLRAFCVNAYTLLKPHTVARSQHAMHSDESRGPLSQSGRALDNQQLTLPERLSSSRSRCSRSPLSSPRPSIGRPASRRRGVAVVRGGGGCRGGRLPSLGEGGLLARLDPSTLRVAQTERLGGGCHAQRQVEGWGSIAAAAVASKVAAAPTCERRWSLRSDRRRAGLRHVATARGREHDAAILPR